MDKFQGNPCVEPSPDVGILLEDEEFPVSIQAGVAWYPGAWVVNMGGNGRAISLRPAENIFHIAASNWNISENDPTNGNLGIAGWNQGAKACTGYNDQYGNLQQYCSVWEQVNGTYQGNYRNRTWEAWNPEGLNGSNAEYNSSTYTPQQCERWSDILAWDANENGARLENMRNSFSGSHGCGVHRFGIDPWREGGSEVWTLHAGKVCPGTARINQLDSIIARSIVIRNAVRDGKCNYLPRGRVNLAQALARTGNVSEQDWWDTVTPQEAEALIRRIVKEEVAPVTERVGQLDGVIRNIFNLATWTNNNLDKLMGNGTSPDSVGYKVWSQIIEEFENKPAWALLGRAAGGDDAVKS